MKKPFKRILALCLTVAVLCSWCAVAFASDSNIEPLVSYNKPTKYLDISTVFADQFNGVNSQTGTGYSDFYFSPGSGQRVHIGSRSAFMNQANASMLIEVMNWTNDSVITSFTVRSDSSGNFTIDKTVSFNGTVQYFYLRFRNITPLGTKVYGAYTIVQT